MNDREQGSSQVRSHPQHDMKSVGEKREATGSSREVQRQNNVSQDSPKPGILSSTHRAQVVQGDKITKMQDLSASKSIKMLREQCQQQEQKLEQLKSEKAASHANRRKLAQEKEELMKRLESDQRLRDAVEKERDALLSEKEKLCMQQKSDHSILEALRQQRDAAMREKEESNRWFKESLKQQRDAAMREKEELIAKKQRELELALAGQAKLLDESRLRQEMSAVLKAPTAEISSSICSRPDRHHSCASRELTCNGPYPTQMPESVTPPENLPPPTLEFNQQPEGPQSQPSSNIVCNLGCRRNSHHNNKGKNPDNQ